ncbi:MAG: hypothetical protein ACLS23_17260 [Clostridioides difficile]
MKDLLYYFPRSYEDRSNIKKIWQLEHDESITKGIISSKVMWLKINKSD